MLPGPQLIYKCPRCNCLISKGSLMSGNTFGGTFYSDGRFFAPMMPQFPKISHCAECKHIFWLNKENLFKSIEWNEPEIDQFEQITTADFLSLEDYLQLIHQNFYRNEEEERFLRFEIWRAFNDRKRNGKSLWNNEIEQYFWKENLERLIAIFQVEWEEAYLTLAELHRNLGMFEKAINILSEIKDKRYQKTVQKLSAECKKLNPYVIEI